MLTIVLVASTMIPLTKVRGGAAEVLRRTPYVRGAKNGHAYQSILCGYEAGVSRVRVKMETNCFDLMLNRVFIF